MATRAENEKAASEKKGPRGKKTKKLAQRRPHVHHHPVRAGKKAAYDEETVAPGKRRTRKSTRRGSKASIKHDTQQTRQTERAVRSPKVRAQKARARGTHPRAGAHS
jgi:hypothetical protein